MDKAKPHMSVWDKIRKGVEDRVKRLLSPDVGKERFADQKDGFGAFGALGTFALAQGAALTAVAKGEKRDNLVLFIYAIIVVFTILWILAMLWASITVEDPKNEGSSQTVPAFEWTSIRFGRWTLIWTVFLGIIMFVLGCMGLLPNQNWRVPYTSTGPIRCEALSADTRLQRSSGTSQKLMDSWIGWINERSRAPTVRFFWVQTKSEFGDYFKPFAVDVEFAPRYLPQRMVAFLLHKDTPASRPTYRQLAFRLGPNNESTNTLDLEDADKGDSVIVLAFAEDKESKSAALPAEDIAWITPHYGGRSP
jgi:hypothetical protein